MDRLAYSVEEAAESLGIGRTAVFGLVRSGVIRSFKLGKRRLISDSALREFVEHEEAGQAP